MTASSPFTWYHQVDSFGPNEEYLSEDDVFYVTLDLGAVEPTLLPSSSTFRLVGLDTPTPFLQLSGSFFRGRYDTLLGSELLFTEEKNDSERNTRSLRHVGATERRIRFKEVQLRGKSHGRLGDGGAPAGNDSNNVAPVGDAGHKLGRMIGSITEPQPRKRKQELNNGKEKDMSAQEERRDDDMDAS